MAPMMAKLGLVLLMSLSPAAQSLDWDGGSKAGMRDRGTWIGPDGEWHTVSVINAKGEWETPYSIGPDGEWSPAGQAIPQAAEVPETETHEARASSCMAALSILQFMEQLPVLPPVRTNPRLDNYTYPYDAFDARSLARNVAGVRRGIQEACSAGGMPDSRLIPAILSNTSKYRKGFSAPYMDPDIRAIPRTVVEGLVRAAQGLFYPIYGD